jgi:hypothetical protein
MNPTFIVWFLMVAVAPATASESTIQAAQQHRERSCEDHFTPAPRLFQAQHERTVPYRAEADA